jgi:hypothetical protein
VTKKKKEREINSFHCWQVLYENQRIYHGAAMWLPAKTVAQTPFAV